MKFKKLSEKELQKINGGVSLSVATYSKNGLKKFFKWVRKL